MTIAVAGSKGVLRVWDALANLGVRKTFGERLKALGKERAALLEAGHSGDGVVRLADESDEEEEEEDA